MGNSAFDDCKITAPKQVKVIVGPEKQEFSIPEKVLSKSPVVSEWIAHPETCPPSLKRDGSFYFPCVEATVFDNMRRILEYGWFPHYGECKDHERPLLNTKVLKLCLSLG